MENYNEEQINAMFEDTTSPFTVYEEGVQEIVSKFKTYISGKMVDWSLKDKKLGAGNLKMIVSELNSLINKADIPKTKKGEMNKTAFKNAVLSAIRKAGLTGISPENKSKIISAISGE